MRSVESGPLLARYWPVADLSLERGDVGFRERTRPRACWLPRAAFDPERKLVSLDDMFVEVVAGEQRQQEQRNAESVLPC